MRFIVFIFLAFVGRGALLAQTVDRDHLVIGAQGRYSHILDGHGIYDNLLGSTDYDIWSVSAGLVTRPEDGGWFEHAWNYPNFGLALSYARQSALHFKNASRLGDILNLSGWAEFDLLRGKRFRSGPLLELGLSYSGQTYDYRTNPYNTYIGSRVFALIGTGWQAEWLFAPQWALQAGAYLTHHSNGMLRSPNLGINEFSAGLGLRHYLVPRSYAKRPAMAPAIPEYRKGLHWHVFAAAGVHSCPVELDGIHASSEPARLAPARLRSIVGAELLWRYSPVFATGLSAEWDYAANNYRETDLLLAGREDPAGYSPHRAGISLVQEFWYRQLSVHVVVGLYVFKKSGLTEDVGRSFQKIGARYHFRGAGGLFAGLDMRAHQLDRSYCLEWSLGYSF